MANDVGITYQAVLKDVREKIQKLSLMSLDMTKTIQLVDDIEENVSQCIQRSYKTFEEGSTSFLYDSLANDYNAAIKKLRDISLTLQREWDEYYVIDATCKVIEEQLKNVHEDSISAIAIAAKKALQSIKSSSTIDYEIEKNIVLHVYDLVYQVMLYEFAYLGHSTLYQCTLDDFADMSYLIEYMRKDLDAMDDDSRLELNIRVYELNQKGLNGYHLFDSELLEKIAYYKHSDIEIRKKEKFLEDAHNVAKKREKILEMHQRSDTSQNEVDSLSEEKKALTKKGIRKRIAITINTLLLSAGLLSGFVLCRGISKENRYKTTTTIYESDLDNAQSSVDYISGSDGSLQIIEYSPWDSPGVFRDGYKRNVYTYNLSRVDEEYENLEDYLTKDLKNDVFFTTSEETSEDIPEDYGYDENKYIITRTEKDLEDVVEVDRPFWWGFLTLFFGTGIGLADAYVFKKVSPEKLKEIKRKRKEACERLDRALDDQNESNKLLKQLDLSEQSDTLDVNQQYRSLPSVVQESDEVQKVMKKLFPQ